MKSRRNVDKIMPTQLLISLQYMLKEHPKQLKKFPCLEFEYSWPLINIEWTDIYTKITPNV